jgi:competence protein ComEA
VPISVRTGRFDPGRRGAAALVAVALLAALGAGGVVLRGRPQEVVVPQVIASGSPLPGSSPSPAAEVVVAVAGKVRSPGLVRLPAGSRVDDAVRAAGGPEPGATTELLNLARKLVDGEQVLVGVDPPPGALAGPAGAAGPPGLLDLNAASVSDLDGLPGIGPVLAQRIVDWRTENERFASVEQLREVTGIGEAKFHDLRAKVTV